MWAGRRSFTSNPFEFFLEPGVEQYPFAYSAELAKDLQAYLEADTPGPSLAAFLADFNGAKDGTINLLFALESKSARRCGLPHPAGTGGAELRRNPAARTGSVATRRGCWCRFEEPGVRG